MHLPLTGEAFRVICNNRYSSVLADILVVSQTAEFSPPPLPAWQSPWRLMILFTGKSTTFPVSPSSVVFLTKAIESNATDNISQERQEVTAMCFILQSLIAVHKSVLFLPFPLCSRQRYVLGDSAMHQMAQSSVFLSGMGGLGIEIGRVNVGLLHNSALIDLMPSH